MNASASDSHPPVICPRCGATLPPDAPEELCPRCLMAMNLETETLASEDAPSKSGPAPDIESLREHFPQLEIHECLGRGGMGVVYRALQKSLNRPVALKLLDPERARDPGFAERFKKEAHALAALNHPNIVTIHDHGEAGGYYFLTMEFVDGVNLRQAMSAGRFTPEEALAIVPPVCEALQYAHDNGIVHRDIKPENLLLDKDGRIKIADFGVAKILGQTESEPETADSKTGGSISGGTPRYMAPEQLNDPGRVDHRADIYAMGVVLYELLTGEAPKGDITPPSKRVEVDVRIDEIVLRALEKEPELRYATAADFRTRVETMAASPAAKRLTATGAWAWSALAIPLAGLAIFTLGMLLAESLEEFRIDANRVIFFLAALISLGIGIWILRRTSRSLRSARSGGRVFLAPEWLGVAGLVLAGLSGILGVFALRQPEPTRILAVLIPVCAILGLGAGILARKNAISWGAIIVGVANLAIALLVATVFASNGKSVSADSAMTFPKAAHISRGGHSVMVHQSGDALDYVMYYRGSINSSSRGSQNRHSLTWIENHSIRLDGNGRSFGYLRESVSPLFLRINGTEYDLRKGRVFQLDADGVNQLPIFPALEDAREPERLSQIIEDQKPAEAVFEPVIERRVNAFGFVNGSEALRLEDGKLFDIADETIFEEGSEAEREEWLEESGANLIPDYVDTDHWNLTLRNVELAELTEADWESLDASAFSETMTDFNWKTDLQQRRETEIVDLVKGSQAPLTFAFRTASGRAGILQLTEFQNDPAETFSINLRYKLLAGDPVPYTRNIQRFVPKAGMESKSNWSVMDKPSGLNPDGWVVTARMTLGGTAFPTLPGESEPTVIKLVKGSSEAVTIEIRDKVRDQTMTFDLVLDRPAQMTLNGKGYRLLFPTTDVSPGDPKTTPYAFLIVKPAETPSTDEDD